MKTSVEIPDELMNKVKDYNLTHKSRPINMSGAFQECLEKIFKETKPDNIIIESEIINNDLLFIETIRNKWWNDKHIGTSIVKAGGIGLINLTNITQKNPDLFETKEECKDWLQNKIKTDPPIIEIETPPPTRKLHLKIPIVNSADPTKPPKFTSNRSTIKCPGCGEEHLELPGTPVKKCANCGFNFDINSQPDQHAPAQDVLPPTPHEAKL